MFSIKKYFVLLALHQTASGMIADSQVSEVRIAASAALFKLSRKESGDMWLKKQADLILRGIEQNTFDLTPEQRISCIQAMHEMIKSILESANAIPDIYIHRIATILQAARHDRDTHPAQFSHELLITNIALRFLDEVGMEILVSFPGLVPDPRRQAAIARVVAVMQAMGYSFNLKSLIGHCHDIAVMIFNMLTKSTSELVAYADHLQLALAGMNALTVRTGRNVKWSYAPMALAMFYCVPALSNVSTETRLANMRTLSNFVGDAGTDSVSLEWASILQNMHIPTSRSSIMVLRRELASAVAMSAMGGPGSVESGAIAILTQACELLVQNPDLSSKILDLVIHEKFNFVSLIRKIQNNEDIQRVTAMLQAILNSRSIAGNAAISIPTPLLITPPSVARIPATTGALVRIRNSLTVWSNAPSSHMETWLPSITGDILLKNDFSASQLNWLDNFLDSKIMRSDSWLETACQYRRFMRIGIIDHPDSPIMREPSSHRYSALAKKLCSNLLFISGVRSVDDDVIREVIRTFESSTELEVVSDQIFQYTLAYKEFQADPNWDSGDTVVDFVPKSLLFVTGDSEAAGWRLREFLRYGPRLYLRRASVGPTFSLEIRDRFAEYARPWADFEPVLRQFGRLYRAQGTIILMKLRDFEPGDSLCNNLNLKSGSVIGSSDELFSGAFRTLSGFGLFGSGIPAELIPVKRAVFRFLEAYVAFVEKVAELEIGDPQQRATWRRIVEEAICNIFSAKFHVNMIRIYRPAEVTYWSYPLSSLVYFTGKLEEQTERLSQLVPRLPVN